MKIRDFDSDNEVREFVEAFEACELPIAEFRHCAHIAVALAYLSESSLGDATERIRSGLLRLLQKNHVAGLPETLTFFWMKLLRHLSVTRYAHLPLWGRINATVASMEASGRCRRIIGAGRSHRDRARERWVAPDLLPVPF